VAVVCHNALTVSTSVPIVLVENVREVMGACAVEFYGNPTERMKVISVTGTNGKTSISWITGFALNQLGEKTGIIGTLGEGIVGNELHVTNVTTPDSIELMKYLNEFRDSDVRAVSMESSSHSIDQDRIHGINFDVCIFTNLTRDHLDYHKTFEAYGEAKKTLFTKYLVNSSKPNKHAIINIDDPFGRVLAGELEGKVQVITYSVKGDSSASVRLVSAEGDALSTTFKLQIGAAIQEFHTQLIGRYNLENVTAAVGAIYALGYLLPDIAEAIETVPTVPGRLQRIAKAGVSVFIDYAHTPDGLTKAVSSLRPLIKNGRIITVFGCGGDRDRGKRPLMARAVAELSDLAIVTSDNPRTEEPIKIIDEIIVGFQPFPTFTYQVEVDRKVAIKKAIEQAKAGDIILVAGKGHEPYQEIKGIKYPFSDAAVAKQFL